MLTNLLCAYIIHVYLHTLYISQLELHHILFPPPDWPGNANFMSHLSQACFFSPCCFVTCPSKLTWRANGPFPQCLQYLKVNRLNTCKLNVQYSLLVCTEPDRQTDWSPVHQRNAKEQSMHYILRLTIPPMCWNHVRQEKKIDCSAFILFSPPTCHKCALHILFRWKIC